MRFTILICTKNRAASLATTLAALEHLDQPGATEVLVVDNGSTDNTKAVTEEAGSRNRIPVRYLLCAAPGKSMALNAGVKATSADIIAFTDDDALPERNWLTEIERTFSQWKCDWVFGPVVPAWETKAPRWYSPRLDGMFAVQDLGTQAFAADHSTPPFFGVNCAVRREALVALGGYRVDLGPRDGYGGGGEDTEMFHRALDAGQGIAYSPLVQVSHVIAAERTTRRFHRRRMFRGGANNYQLLQAAKTPGPRWLGIPRFHFGLAVSNALMLPLDYLRGRHDEAFMREIQLIRFISVCRHGLSHAGRGPQGLNHPSDPAAKQPSEAARQ